MKIVILRPTKEKLKKAPATATFTDVTVRYENESDFALTYFLNHGYKIVATTKIEG